MDKTIAAGIVGALVLGGGVAAELQVPAYEQRDDFIKGSVARAKEERDHLTERVAYMEANRDELAIPQSAIDKAHYAKNEFDGYLQRKKMVDGNGNIKESPKGVIEPILGALSLGAMKAYAFTFGKEDFESCGAIPCTFTTNGSYGSGNFALDATSKVNGTDSARCDITAADDGCVLQKTLTSASQYYTQYYIFFPSGWTFGVNGYLSIWATEDGVGNPVYCNVEDFGALRIICDGDELAYTDTGLNIALNTKTRLEFRTKISGTVGDVDIWLNNTTEGSPDYNGSGTLNTGTQNITGMFIGGYHPDIVNDKWYDDVIVDTAFIGSGTPAASTPEAQPMVQVGGAQIQVAGGQLFVQ